MKCSLVLSGLLFLFAGALAAQQPEKPKLELQLGADLQSIRVQFRTEGPPSRYFHADATASYELLEILEPDSPEMHTKKLDKAFASAAVEEPVGPTVNLTLAQPLNYGQSYFLVVSYTTGLNQSQRVWAKIDVAAGGDLYVGDADHLRDFLYLKSLLPLEPASADRRVVVEEKYLRVEFDPKAGSYKAVSKTRERLGKLSAIDTGKANIYVIELDSRHKLAEGGAHSLRVKSGLRVKSDLQPVGAEAVKAAKAEVKAEGVISTEALPTDEEELRFNAKLSWVAGVHQKPVFELAGLVKPKFLEFDPFDNWTWSVAGADVDVGLRSTRAANSVKFFSSLSHTFLKPPKSKAGYRGKLQGYTDWSTRPWYDLSGVRFEFGPLFEADREFNRRNMLGTARLDFHFFRWRRTIAAQRKYILNDLFADAEAREKAGMLQGINTGFDFVPYIAFDFGGHVTNEVLSKNTATLTVPKHGIFRVRAGLTGKLEYRRFAFAFDGTLFALALREQIGYETSTGVALRSLRGIHHRAKGSFDYLLDSAGHYKFSITYENGRQSPDMDYLNRVTSGLRFAF